MRLLPNIISTNFSVASDLMFCERSAALFLTEVVTRKVYRNLKATLELNSLHDVRNSGDEYKSKRGSLTQYNSMICITEQKNGLAKRKALTRF
jgi:hypothetical protein